jgi:hypothetical protein
MTMRDLDQIIEWVEMGNKSLFNPLDCKATLYIFENFYQETENGSFRQKRRSLPLDPLVFESFQDLFKELIRFVQGRLLTQDSEIRMGLVFKPFNLEKKRKREKDAAAEGRPNRQNCLHQHTSVFSLNPLQQR